MKLDIVSVIIPVYKVEKELKRCIQSVIEQTYRNLEIILIDDGSPDGCPQICDIYKEKDKRIKVIHKENGGLSSARNSGLEVACGEYISFVDSDDWIAKDFIETLVSNAKRENAEISIAGYTMVWESGKSRNFGCDDSYCVYDSDQAIRELLIQKKFSCMVCQKLYKKSIFEKIRFPEGKPYEDVAIALPTFLKATKIVFSGKSKYYYYQRNDSIVNSKFTPNKLFFLECCIQIINYSDSHLGIYDCEAHTFYLRALMLLLFKIYETENYKGIRKDLEREIAKQKKYIWNNPYLESRKKIVLTLILIKFPKEPLLALWKKRVRG